MRNFASLRQAVYAQPATAVSENASGICIAHGRTDLVTSLVMAAGRSPEGVAYPGLRDPVRLFFVAGDSKCFYFRVLADCWRDCAYLPGQTSTPWPTDCQGCRPIHRAPWLRRSKTVV